MSDQPVENRRYVLAPASVAHLSKNALLGVPLAMDDRGFVYVRGLQVFKYISESQEIEFVDKDDRRAERRGGRMVRMPLSQLKAIVEMFRILEDGVANGPPPALQPKGPT